MVKKLLCLLFMLLIPLSAWASEQPILVSVGLSSDTVKVDGRNIKAAGVGKRTPWGIHEADVIYETMCYQTGQTRLGCLFRSRFPESVGPVRSARVSHFALQAEWNAALVYNGDAGSAAWDWLDMDGFDRNSEQLLNTQKIPWIRSFRSREKGIKAPDNLSLNVKALAATLELEPSEPLPKTLSVVDGTAVTEITLHWGNDESQSKLLYDPASQQYLMYRRSVPFLSAFSPQDRTVGVQLAFDCVIVQHANYQWPQTVVPVMTGIGTGSAHLYVNGQ